MKQQKIETIILTYPFAEKKWRVPSAAELIKFSSVYSPHSGAAIFIFIIFDGIYSGVAACNGGAV